MDEIVDGGCDLFLCLGCESFAVDGSSLKQPLLFLKFLAINLKFLIMYRTQSELPFDKWNGGGEIHDCPVGELGSTFDLNFIGLNSKIFLGEVNVEVEIESPFMIADWLERKLNVGCMLQAFQLDMVKCPEDFHIAQVNHVLDGVGVVSES